LEGKEGDAKSYALQQRETNVTLGSEELQGAIHMDARENTWALCTSPLNLERAASAIISLCLKCSTKTTISIEPNFGFNALLRKKTDSKSLKTGELLFIHSSLVWRSVTELITADQGLQHTLCISVLEVKAWATFSKLSFKTSVITAVMASACFAVNPWDSSLRTCHSKNIPWSACSHGMHHLQIQIEYTLLNVFYEHGCEARYSKHTPHMPLRRQ
jgi:hypothetical protein